MKSILICLESEHKSLESALSNWFEGDDTIEITFGCDAHSIDCRDLQSPFKLGAILDRINQYNAQTGHQYANMRDIIDLGGRIFLSPSERSIQLNYNEALVMLTDKERDLLCYLHFNRDNAPISRAEILKEVFGYTYDTDTHTLETHIYRLRQKIEKDPQEPQILLTDESGYHLKSL